MARIEGIDLPRTKRIETALTYIYGIGPNRAKKILYSTRVNPDTRVKDLTESDELLRNYFAELQGRRRPAPRGADEYQTPDRNWRYRGLRTPQPAGGQRTRTNARRQVQENRGGRGRRHERPKNPHRVPISLVSFLTSAS